MTVKTALITGTSRPAGLGFAVARRLAELGYHVVLTARDASRAEPLAEQLRQDGLAATALRLDLTDQASMHDLMVTTGAGYRAHRGRAGPPGVPVPAGPGPARNRAASRRAPFWSASLIPAASAVAARSGPIAGLADTRDSPAGKTTEFPQRQPPA